MNWCLCRASFWRIQHILTCIPTRKRSIDCIALHEICQIEGRTWSPSKREPFFSTVVSRSTCNSCGLKPHRIDVGRTCRCEIGDHLPLTHRSSVWECLRMRLLRGFPWALHKRSLTLSVIICFHMNQMNIMCVCVYIYINSSKKKKKIKYIYLKPFPSFLLYRELLSDMQKKLVEISAGCLFLLCMAIFQY